MYLVLNTAIPSGAQLANRQPKCKWFDRFNI